MEEEGQLGTVRSNNRENVNCLKFCYVERMKKVGGPGAIVPTLFSEEAVEAMRILMQHRESLGIYKRNKYIFASGELYLKG